VCEKLHERLLAELHAADQLEWERAIADSSHLQAKKGHKTGPSPVYGRLVWQRGVKPIVARLQTEHGSGLGRHRWVVERTFAWLHNRRGLIIRTDRRDGDGWRPR
jgi:transposase